jgi:hypothetical protein
MPSLRDGIAALVAHASVDVDAARQFIVFPNFYFPLDKDDLAFNDIDAAFAFALNINMIPAGTPQFNLTTKFVWDVYKDVLNNKVLPAPAAGGQGFARQFVEAVAQLGIPQMTPNEFEFYSTSILPVSLDDAAAWTPVVLGRDAISQLATTLPEDHKAWLTRFNLLPQLGDGFLESISMEKLTLNVLRPWYNPSVCTWRFWDLPGRTISDGNGTPRGELPGVIGKIVLARKVCLKLAATLLPDAGPIMFQPTDSTGGESAEVSAQLLRLGGGDAVATPGALVFKSFQQGTGTIADRIVALEKDLAREIGASDTAGHAALTVSGGFQRFHVPFSFDTQQARDHTAAALATAAANRAAKESEFGAASSRLHELTQTKLQWQANPPLVHVRDHRDGKLIEYTRVNTGLVQKLEHDLAQQQTVVGSKQQELVRAQAEETRARNSLTVIEQLAAIPASAQSYVLALEVDRTPKSPNPDPALVALA